MYRNLKAELVRQGLTQKELGAMLGWSPMKMSCKLNDKSPLTWAEALRIRECLHVDIPMDVLFARED